MRGRPGHSETIRAGPPEPHPGFATSQPLAEKRQGRRRVAPRPEPVLVRWKSARSEARLPPHRRPPRSGSPGTDSTRVREHGDGTDRVRRRAGAADRDTSRPGQTRGRALALRRQPERQNHVQGRPSSSGGLRTRGASPRTASSTPKQGSMPSSATGLAGREPASPSLPCTQAIFRHIIRLRHSKSASGTTTGCAREI